MLSPTHLVSLWDMLLPYCNFMGSNLLTLRTMEGEFNRDSELEPSKVVEPEQVAVVKYRLDTIYSHCLLARLDNCAALVKHIQHDFETQPWLTAARAAGLMQELLRAIQFALSTKEYLYVPAQRAIHYSEPLRDWGDVPARFPSAVTDITEAEKCFALERYTATVYHLMLVMESGLRALGRHVGVRKKNPTWDAILGAMDRKLNPKPGVKKTGRWRKREPFIAEAAAHLRSVKIAWRNPSMHVIGQDHDDLSAESVLRAVRTFMAHLAPVVSERRR